MNNEEKTTTSMETLLNLMLCYHILRYFFAAINMWPPEAAYEPTV